MSAAFISPDLGKRISGHGPDAMASREVDGLIARLLGEIKVPFNSTGKRVLGQLIDFKKVLSADYLEESAMPEKHLIRELARVVDADVKSYDGRWNNLDSPEVVDRLFRKFGPREIELRAEPYRQGAGLSLRGFFCRTKIGDSSKFVIFVNTAHHPAAIAATLGHELGHYIYGGLVGEKASMTAFMEGAFSNHLKEGDELFADSLVALAAYSKDLMTEIGAINGVTSGSSDELFKRIRKAYSLMGSRYNVNLKNGNMASAWRVRYLTSMTHFFKLRCALYQSAGL
ncbi:MAG TPA: hypothetical protein VNF29_14925 [Candidatus Binataceae bacterium]|nr:hypothetical protein [Candidatus Binataceae bacterium]HVA82218.1 hypothetical protein [Candidatus Binataceae bacterium]